MHISNNFYVYTPLSQCRPLSRPLRHEEVLQRQTLCSHDPLAETVRTGLTEQDRCRSKVNSLIFDVDREIWFDR